jgi:hypothetical protein
MLGMGVVGVYEGTDKKQSEMTLLSCSFSYFFSSQRSNKNCGEVFEASLMTGPRPSLSLSPSSPPTFSFRRMRPRLGKNIFAA